MPTLTSNSLSISLRMSYLSCVKIRELHCPAKTEQKLALGGCHSANALALLLCGASDRLQYEIHVNTEEGVI